VFWPLELKEIRNMNELTTDRTKTAAAGPAQANGGENANNAGLNGPPRTKEAVLARQEAAINWLRGEIALEELDGERSFVERYLDVLTDAKKADVPEELFAELFRRAGFPDIRMRKVAELMEACRSGHRKAKAHKATNGNDNKPAAQDPKGGAS
jgi:hypothetical protein